MSNPSQEKAPVVLKSEQAKMDLRESSGQTLEQQAHQRLLNDSVPETTAKTVLKTGIEKNVRLKSDGSIVDLPDRADQNKQNNLNKKDSQGMPGKSGTSYPEAQLSHDATGKLDHIDLKPSKDH
jgi:hypothetical protein